MEEELNRDEQEHQLVRSMLALCAKREYTTLQIRRKLIKKDVDNDMQERVLDRLQAMRAIDDLRFAEMFIMSAARRGVAGPKKIAQKLYERGITEEQSASIVEEHYPEERQRECIHQELEKYIRKSSSQRKPEQRRDKALQFLSNRGFAPALIIPILDEHNIQNHTGTSEEDVSTNTFE